MNLFKQFLREAVEPDLHVIYKGLTGRKHDQAAFALGKLLLAKEKKEIYNTEFNDSKQAMQRALESNLERIENELEKPSKLALYDSSFSHYANLNEYARNLRAIQKIVSSKADNKATDEDMKHLHDILEISTAAIEYKKLIDEIKPYVKKGKKPRPVDPNKFRSRLGSKEAQEAVKEHLSAGIKKVLDDYEENVRKFFQDMIDEYKEKDEYVYDRKKANEALRMVISKCFHYKITRDPKTGNIHYHDLEANSEADHFSRLEAEKMRKSIENEFLAKNVMKLSQIVDLKDNLERIEELPYRAPKLAGGAGTIEAGFTFDFTDGSSFQVVNKVVIKYSFKGTRFAQFPTTFHKVRLPDGSMMGTPSEEKMVKEFGPAVKVPEDDNR